MALNAKTVAKALDARSALVALWDEVSEVTAYHNDEPERGCELRNTVNLLDDTIEQLDAVFFRLGLHQ